MNFAWLDLWVEGRKILSGSVKIDRVLLSIIQAIRRNRRGWELITNGLAKRLRSRSTKKGLSNAVSPAIKNYFARPALSESVLLQWPEQMWQSLTADAELCGVPKDARVITIHVKEDGFDKLKYNEKIHRRQITFNATRSAKICDYLPAIDYLAESGFVVVRVGDKSMSSIKHPSLIDLATSEFRSNQLELYMISRSELMIASESGGYLPGVLLNVPILRTNVTHPIVGYPPNEKDLYSIKRMRDKETNKWLTPTELLGPLYLREFESIEHQERYQYEDNAPEEHIASVQEMLALLQDSGEVSLSPKQKQWRQMVCGASNQYRHLCRYLMADRAIDDFIGHGRIVEWQLKDLPW
jgi:putative glycosyltransferase (TIGR04372 family)